MPVTHLLLNWRSIGPCGCPIPSSAWQIGIIYFLLIKSAPFSASCEDEIIASIILETTSIAPLWAGGEKSGRMGNVGF